MTLQALCEDGAMMSEWSVCVLVKNGVDGAMSWNRTPRRRGSSPLRLYITRRDVEKMFHSYRGDRIGVR